MRAAIPVSVYSSRQHRTLLPNVDQTACNNAIATGTTGLSGAIGTPHHPVEVEFHFVVNDATETFGQAARLIFRFPDAYDLFKRSPRRNGEGRLIDNLVPSVELGDDEMTGGPVGQHPVAVGVMVRTESWK